MSTEVTAVFKLVDDASSALRKIEAQSKLTQKSLNSMSGVTGTQRASLARLAQSTDQLSAKQAIQRDVLKEVAKADSEVRKSFIDTHQTLGPLAQRVDRLVGSWRSGSGPLSALHSGMKNLKNDASDLRYALQPLADRFEGVNRAAHGALGGVTGLVKGLPLMPTLIVAAIQPALSLAGALGALASSLGGAVGGAGLLGGGLLSAFGVGLGSVVIAAKPAMAAIKQYTKLQTALNTAIASGSKPAVEKAQKNFDTFVKGHKDVATFASSLDQFKKSFASLSGAGQPALFQTVTTAMNAFQKQLPVLKSEVASNLGAIRDAFQSTFGKYLGSSEFGDFIKRLGQVFRANIVGVMQSVVNIGHAFYNILKVIQPQLMGAGSAMERLTKRFQDWTASGQGISRIQEMTHAFHEWMSLLGGVARLIGVIAGAGMRQGTDVVATWAKQVNALADRLSKPIGQHSVENYFKNALSQSAKIWDALKGLVGQVLTLSKVLNPFAAAATFILRNLPPGAITAILSMVGLFKIATGVKSGLDAFRGTPANPMVVVVEGGSGVGTPGGTTIYPSGGGTGAPDEKPPDEKPPYSANWGAVSQRGRSTYHLCQSAWRSLVR